MLQDIGSGGAAAGPGARPECPRSVPLPSIPSMPSMPTPLLPLAPSGARGRSAIRAPSRPKPPVGLNCRS